MERCSKDPNYYCDTVLVKYSNPVPKDDADGKLRRSSTITIDNTGADPGAPETFTTSITTTWEQPEKYVLYEIGYFAGVGGYDGSNTWMIDAGDRTWTITPSRRCSIGAMKA